MGSAHSSAWKSALGLFFSILAITICWNLITRTKESLFLTFGFPAGVALLVYLVKRGDIFD